MCTWLSRISDRFLTLHLFMEQLRGAVDGEVLFWKGAGTPDGNPGPDGDADPDGDAVFGLGGEGVDARGMALAVPLMLIALATLRVTDDIAAVVVPVKLISLAMFEAIEGINGVGDAAELADVTGVNGGGIPDVTGGARTRTDGGTDGGNDVVE